MNQDNRLTLQHVTKYHRHQGRPVCILDQVNLTVEPGEFLSIVGPSGSGKSTLLRLIVGLDTEYQGRILVGDRPVTGPGRDRGIVFQDHRLFPWMTVYENVAFALSEEERRAERDRVMHYLTLVGLQDYHAAYPHQLSGGMAQRVAIARALVSRPRILVLDEPFGALDAFTRFQMQQELIRIWREEGTTMVIVTHDIDEAIYLGDRVAILSGRPATFRKTYRIALSRPRDRTSDDFLLLRRAIHREFFGAVEPPFAYSI